MRLVTVAGLTLGRPIFFQATRLAHLEQPKLRGFCAFSLLVDLNLVDLNFLTLSFTSFTFVDGSDEDSDTGREDAACNTLVKGGINTDLCSEAEEVDVATGANLSWCAEACAGVEDVGAGGVDMVSS